MNYVNPKNICTGEIVRPGEKHFEWEKENYGWRLILMFENCPSVFIECDSMEQCEDKAKELNLILI